ncbi:NADH-quinone oxidoreductase subunit L [Marinobacter koreensis]|uniref:Probable inorganic carbon transporter subunit DabB n=2 Tax=Marinobacter koreensis TaxID=335974 RepID=A0ABW0RJR3_9GAMM|nr:NADH-quinone oxidoreductase subunit L [Marinobacter koreensis]MCK7548370.1 NADH-quinone oxidoreductase subunit L [Marinobacter koreensis]
MAQPINYLSLATLIVWLAAPLSVFVLALLCQWFRSPLKAEHCWRIAEGVILFAMAGAALVGGMLILDGWLADTALLETGRNLGVYPAGLAVWMSLMVAFIGWIILRYARDYLRGDPAREVFLPWFLTTLACVQVLVITDHLLILAGAWIGVSLSLHQLLTLYPDRPQARMAAAQKFIASRLGDACVIAGVLLIANYYGSFHLQDLDPALVQNPNGAGGLQAASVLLALAAAIKCAQVPFHGWLLRVMEAPTPVSALLHAGIINLGGFLWLRLFPLFEGFTYGHAVLLVVGGGTALVAVLTMMTQVSVKHALAWSTIAQMGFMLFEIALGAYALAALHLLAHSLYKAHSFLASGRTVKVAARVSEPGRLHIPVFALAMTCGVLAGGALWLWPGLVEGKSVLAGLLILAVVNLVLGIPAVASMKSRLLMAGLALALLPLYAALHMIVSPALSSGTEMVLPAAATIGGWLILATLTALSILVVYFGHSGIGRTLHASFSQGLFLEQPFEHLTRRLASRALNAPTSGRHHLTGYPVTAGDHS